MMFTYENLAGARVLGLTLGSRIHASVSLWKQCDRSWGEVNGKYLYASVFQTIFGVTYHQVEL